jgi:hypothetical protein
VNRAVLSLIVALTLLGACAHRTGTSQSNASSGGYLATKLCGFNLDGKRSEVRYRIELGVLRPLPRGSLVEVAFENPLDPTAPLMTSHVMAGDERDAQFVSPPVKGIRERPYEILVRVYSSADKAALVSTHKTLCESPFNQRELGPEYH